MGRMFIVCSRVVGNTTKNVYLYACVAMSLANVPVVLFISFFSVSPVSKLFHTLAEQFNFPASRWFKGNLVHILLTAHRQYSLTID